VPAGAWTGARLPPSRGALSLPPRGSTISVHEIVLSAHGCTGPRALQPSQGVRWSTQAAFCQPLRVRRICSVVAGRLSEGRGAGARSGSPGKSWACPALGSLGWVRRCGGSVPRCARTASRPFACSRVGEAGGRPCRAKPVTGSMGGDVALVRPLARRQLRLGMIDFLGR